MPVFVVFEMCLGGLFISPGFTMDFWPDLLE